MNITTLQIATFLDFIYDPNETTVLETKQDQNSFLVWVKVFLES